jgi:hypothetical protein
MIAYYRNELETAPEVLCRNVEINDQYGGYLNLGTLPTAAKKGEPPIVASPFRYALNCKLFVENLPPPNCFLNQVEKGGAKSVRWSFCGKN